MTSTTSRDRDPPQQQSISQRMAEIKRNEAKKLLDSKGIQLGSTEMAQKKDPGKNGTVIEKLLTNGHYLNFDRNRCIYQFDIRVTGVGQTTANNEIIRDFTRRGNLDFTRSDHRSTCYAAFKCWLGTQWVQNNLVQNGNVIYYDLENILYAVKEIEMDTQGLQWEFKREDLNRQTKRVDDPSFHTYLFKIKPTTKTLTGQNQLTISRDASKIDRSLLQFLDIATSQHVFSNRDNFLTFSASLTYMLVPESFGFTNLPNFSANDSFLRVGLRKASHFIEGDKGKLTSNIALIIENKKSAFHNDKSAINKLRALLPGICDGEILQNRALTIDEFNLIAPIFTGIEVELMHLNRIVCVRGISEKNAFQQTFLATFNGDRSPIEVNVAQYLQRRYPDLIQNIQYPLLPLVIYRTNPNSSDSYIPLEFCNVLDDQRVKGQQQRLEQIRKMIDLCAVSPDKHLDELNRLTKSFALEDNQELNGAGIRYNNQLIQVDARVLNHPNIAVDGKVYEVNRKDTRWDMYKTNFLSPPIYRSRWVAYSFGTGSSRYNITLDDWRHFVNLFTQDMRTRARGFPDATAIDIIPRDMELQTLILQEMPQTEFFLIAHDTINGDLIHARLKYLERKFDIITQSVKIQTVYAFRSGQRPRLQTIGNIANKANVKMGGLNYNLVIDEELRPIFDNTLFVGFSMNHPGSGPVPGASVSDQIQQAGNGNNDRKNAGNTIQKRGSPPTAPGNGNGQQQPTLPVKNIVHFPKPPPSVVGWASNITSCSRLNSFSFEYIGDFVYQEARREENITIINQVVGHCIDKYYEQAQKFPKQIVILRNACSEGQFQDILRFEVPLLKHTISEKASLLGNATPSKLMIISPNKKQGIRFFKQGINSDDKDADKNISAGTVIDTCIVHPTWQQFYLNSHVAICGTARTPRYTLIYDDNNFSTDQLQCMMHYLCFGHQIINSPTSLPSPIFIAEEYAKRGRNLFNHFYYNGDINGQDRNGNGIPRHYPQTYEELTQLLSYARTEFLSHLRINA